MSKPPYDSSCEAEYEDGFILNETEHEDRSAYLPTPLVDGVPTGPNTISDILEKRPEAEHGKLVRFSIFWKNLRHDFDFTVLPENARPIRYRHNNNSLNTSTGEQTQWYSGVGFGFQYTDENGENQQHVEELQ